MWFYIRFLMAVYIFRKPPTHRLLDWVVSRHRVWPWDLDANMHMNNVRYLKHMETGRVDHMIQTPWLLAMHDHHLGVVVANTEISYVRELKPFQAFDVETCITSWDEKYIYVDQLFTYGNTVFTAAIVRLAMLDTQNGKRVSPVELFSRIYPDISISDLPASAQHLNLLIQAQRQETQPVAMRHREPHL